MSEAVQATQPEWKDTKRLLDSRASYRSVSDQISDVPLEPRIRVGWLVALMIGSFLSMILTIAIAWLFYKGVGIWGIDIPVAWGFAITNFVWWIGIGHAGTLISAILLLLHQKWRNSINRSAEAMTLFAVACAGLFPLLHLGRPWIFYYLVPYPNSMGLWPQWRSPLVWDVFAVTTYATVSLLFWYTGLIPDMATMRDRAQKKTVKIFYGVLAMGWRGASRHWGRLQTLYLLLAGLATPLVISVHSIVGLDFTIAQTPGWHSTIFPPYFVAGAIFSGFAMVLTLLIPARAYYGLHNMITNRHLDLCAKLMLATGLIVDYGYISETFFAYYSGSEYEICMIENRMAGPYSPAYWTLIFCNLVVLQLLWFRKIRLNPIALFSIAIVVNIGMWLERYVIVITSLHRDFLPSSWGMYYPTIWDYATFFGTIGLFFTLFLLFIRFMPMVSIYEMRELISKDHRRAEE